MDLINVIFTLLVSMVTVIQCHMGHMPQAPESVPHHQQAVNQNMAPSEATHHGHGTLHDKAQVHDRDHVMEHYDGVINPEQKLSDEELNFHYFKVHDYDQNNRLDGIELISALTHYHKSENANVPRMSDDELSEMIDSILREDDADNDGFIDYPEFIMSQNRAAP